MRKYELATDDLQVFTVTQITKEIRTFLEERFSDIWIEGEISNYTMSSAGHAYFSLKDKNSVLNCVLFKGNSARMAFEPEDGMQVLCHGKVSVYDKRGQYQLYVSKIEPRGKGALQVAFEKLKKKLYEEGLFDEDQKQTIPFLPARVGIITSPTGAAVKDIIQVSQRRYSNIELLIRPVRVQGEEAKHDIVQAIEELNEYNKWISAEGKDNKPVDVIILGRGGGSLEDLWAFNEEIVARAIFDSEIPVVSAVGHEIDYTISDFVADLRAATPSAAAEIVVPLKEELEEKIDEYIDSLMFAVKTKIESEEKNVAALKNSYILRSPINVFLQIEQQVDELCKKAISAAAHTVKLKEKDLVSLEGKLKALSPLAVLERGYSITFKDGAAVKDASGLKKGDTIISRVFNGEIESKVEKTKK